MSEADLEHIRAARLQQLREQQGSPSGQQRSQGQADDSQQKQRESEARQHILSQILMPSSFDRLNRIRLVKESRATDVENRLIMLARSGQLRQKVDEEQLKEILGALSEQQERSGMGGGGAGRLSVVRKGGSVDDDDDDLEDLLRDV